MNNFLWRRHVRIERRLRDRLNPLEEFSDEKCLQIFCFDKNTIVDILNAIQNNLSAVTNHSSPIPPVLQLCCALRILATGDMIRTVGDSLRISKSTTSRILERVLNSVVQHLQHKIRYPQGDALRQVQKGFFRNYHLGPSFKVK